MEQASTSTDLAVADPVIVVAELVADSHYGVFNIADIRKSKTNRKRFKEEALNELAQNIKANGLIQPILIRPVTPTEAEPEAYELVCGERRWRASIIAGLSTINAICRNLSDSQAAELQLIENLQREDPHPLEEAEGYQALMLENGYTADMLADKLKKSRSYIYGRLKLCNLCRSVREKFFADKNFNASLALLIARIPVPALQEKALDEIMKPGCGGDSMSYRAAFQHVQNRYMLELEDAIFAPEDAKLIALVGSCKSCPKRTGNDPVFSDIENKNICTDPDCFAEKTSAHHAKRITWAHKNGIPVLEGDEAIAAARNSHSAASMAVSENISLYHFGRVKKSTNQSQSIKDALGEKSMPKPKQMAIDHDGEVIAIYDKLELQQALEKAGLCLTAEEQIAAQAANQKDTSGDDDGETESEEDKQQKKLEARALAEQEYRLTLYKKLRYRGFTGLNIASLRVFVKHILNDLDLYADLPEAAQQEFYGETFGTTSDIENYIDNASIVQIQLLLVDLVFGQALAMPSYGWGLRNFINREDDAAFDALIAMAEAEGISTDQDEHPTESAEAEQVNEPESSAGETSSEAAAKAPTEETPPAPTPKKRPRKSIAVIVEPNKSNASEPWPFPTAERLAELRSTGDAA